MDILQPSVFDNQIFNNSNSAQSPVLSGIENVGTKVLYFLGDVLPFLFSQTTWEIIKFIMSAVASFFIIIIIYSLIRTLEIRAKEHEYWHHAIQEYAEKQKKRELEESKKKSVSVNAKWVRVLELLSSQDMASWKIAVIEADTMLDELLSRLGFQGSSIGEKLKSADPKVFRKMALAWEVHTVRNKIAHEGSEFTISLQEANRVISIYEEIFRDYDFI